MVNLIRTDPPSDLRYPFRRNIGRIEAIYILYHLALHLRTVEVEVDGISFPAETWLINNPRPSGSYQLGPPNFSPIHHAWSSDFKGSPKAFWRRFAAAHKKFAEKHNDQFKLLSK